MMRFRVYSVTCEWLATVERVYVNSFDRLDINGN